MIINIQSAKTEIFQTNNLPKIEKIQTNNLTIFEIFQINNLPEIEKIQPFR